MQKWTTRCICDDQDFFFINLSGKYVSVNLSSCFCYPRVACLFQFLLYIVLFFVAWIFNILISEVIANLYDNLSKHLTLKRITRSTAWEPKGPIRNYFLI